MPSNVSSLRININDFAVDSREEEEEEGRGN